MYISTPNWGSSSPPQPIPRHCCAKRSAQRESCEAAEDLRPSVGPDLPQLFPKLWA